MREHDAVAPGDTIYSVVVNGEGQYSIWPEGREVPRGWTPTGRRGPKSDCLSYIDAVWLDMRPARLRERGGGARIP
jgi:MbtH protein